MSKSKQQKQDAGPSIESQLYTVAQKERINALLGIAGRLGFERATDALIDLALEDAFNAGYADASGVDPLDPRFGPPAGRFDEWYVRRLPDTEAPPCR